MIFKCTREFFSPISPPASKIFIFVHFLIAIETDKPPNYAMPNIFEHEFHLNNW